MRRTAAISLSALLAITLLLGCSPKSAVSTSSGSSSSADSESTTQTTQPAYEKVEPLYKETYSTNFYVYEPCHDDNFGKDMSQYIKIVNAVLGYETKGEWRFVNPPKYVSDFYDNTFDEFNPLAALVSTISYGFDDNTFEITYRYNTKAEHEKAIAKIDAYFANIIHNGMPADAGKFVKTVVVYQNVMQAMNYYTGELRGKARIYTYDTFDSGLGVCHTYAYTCRFALAQLGIETLQATGFIKDTSSYHEWFMAKLYGNWYHFDPTYEDNNLNKFGLRYFGMTAKGRAERGSIYETYYGKLAPYRKPVPEAVDEKFAALWDVVGFTVLNGKDVQCRHMGKQDYENFVFTCE